MKKKNIRNTVLNFASMYIFYILRTIIDVYKISLFNDILGIEIYTLNQYYVQIFTLISIVEGGIGTAIVYKLYKPLSEGDHDRVNVLYSTIKKYFRIVGFIILGISLLVPAAIPFLRKDNIFPLWYLYLTFLIYVVRNVLTYFMCAPRFIIQADHRMYKINVVLYGGKVIEQIVEIGALLAGFEYWLYLIPAAVIRYGQNLMINRKVFREYPWLTEVDERDVGIYQDMKNLLVIRGVNFIHNNSDLFIINYFYGDIHRAMYSRYYYVVKFCKQTGSYLYTSLKHGVGKDYVTSDRDSFLKEMSNIRALFSFVTVTLVVLLYFSLNPFINIWTRGQLVATIPVMCLWLGTIYTTVMLYEAQMLASIRGLFHRVRNWSVLAAVINIGVSIILVPKYDIAGVLVGTIVSDFLIYIFCYSYVGYKDVTGGYKFEYISHHFKNLIIIAAVCWIMRQVNVAAWLPPTGYLKWFIYSVVNSLICLVFIIPVFALLYPANAKDLIRKLKNFLNRKESIEEKE